MANSVCSALFALAVFASTATAQAQGCSQCRDTVSQTNPAQQQSYRLAIGIMLVAALSVGATGILVVRRFGR